MQIIAQSLHKFSVPWMSDEKNKGLLRTLAGLYTAGQLIREHDTIFAT